MSRPNELSRPPVKVEHLKSPHPNSGTMTSRHGLANIGNTCYLNSAIQALGRFKPFADYFGTDKWKIHRHPDRKGHDMAGHLAEIVTALHQPGTQIIIPSKFVRAFVEFAHEINDEIQLGAQADAAEAVQILLDGLHMQQAREVRMDISGTVVTIDQAAYIKSLESWSTFFHKEYSPLIEHFYGQTQTSVICAACKATSTRYEPWGVLKLPIPGAEKQGSPAPSFNECIAAAVASETLDDYVCSACSVRGPAAMNHAISHFPKHMIVSLKRFTNAGSKVRARIPYDPNSIDMSPYRAWASIQGEANYRVLSTVEHMGGNRGGHYCMRTRESDNSWLVYDDGRCGPSPIGGDAGPDTYMLFLEML
jgi:ubiquitin C-terminal hydrolase